MTSLTGNRFSVISGIVAGFGMSMLQIAYALYWVSAIYDRYNILAQMFLPLSIVLWVVTFALIGSFAAKRHGSGGLAGFWAGLSGALLSSGGVCLSFRLIYPVFMTGFLADPSVVISMFLVILLILMVLGVLIGALASIHK